MLIVGGGLTGLQTAYLLKQAGLTVILIERHRLGRGVSGHTTAKITALHGLTYRRLAGSFGTEAAQVYAAANSAGPGRGRAGSCPLRVRVRACRVPGTAVPARGVTGSRVP